MIYFEILNRGSFRVFNVRFRSQSLKVGEKSTMDSRLIFQLTASAIASICSGASLAFWLLSTEALSQPGLSKKRLILSQAVIGGVIILGSVVSVFLAIRQVYSKNSK